MLQKSPSSLCEIEILNNRIGAPVLLNRCCVFALDLESMFPAEMLKRLLQHNLPGADIGGDGKVRTILDTTGLNLNLSRIVSIFRTIQRSHVRA